MWYSGAIHPDQGSGAHANESRDTSPGRSEREPTHGNDDVSRNLKGMDELDFKG